MQADRKINPFYVIDCKYTKSIANNKKLTNSSSQPTLTSLFYIVSKSYFVSRWQYHFLMLGILPFIKIIETPVLYNFCFPIVKINSKIILFLGKKYWSHDGLK